MGKYVTLLCRYNSAICGKFIESVIDVVFLFVVGDGEGTKEGKLF